jgi:hypothetical protein
VDNSRAAAGYTSCQSVLGTVHFKSRCVHSCTTLVWPVKTSARGAANPCDSSASPFLLVSCCAAAGTSAADAHAGAATVPPHQQQVVAIAEDATRRAAEEAAAHQAQHGGCMCAYACACACARLFANGRV